MIFCCIQRVVPCPATVREASSFSGWEQQWKLQPGTTQERERPRNISTEWGGSAKSLPSVLRESDESDGGKTVRARGYRGPQENKAF